jgi:hypothetical protein
VRTVSAWPGITNVRVMWRSSLILNSPAESQPD